jgi:hypothetical protein
MEITRLIEYALGLENKREINFSSSIFLLLMEIVVPNA